jgi:copper chaperone CopZ
LTTANGRVSFTVSSLDCIACMPIFQKNLASLKGIESVKPLPMLNKIVVEFSPVDVSEEEVKNEVTSIAEKAGLAKRIIFVR